MASRLTLVASTLLAAALLAGCASPDESAGDPGAAQDACAPGSHLAGESGYPNGTTGSGTGDVTTADGGDPSRSPDDVSAANDAQCPPGLANATEDEGRASTGLGEPGGGLATAPE